MLPSDAKAGRYVSNLNSLTVVSVATVPVPASAVLLLTGLLGVGFTGFRKHMQAVLTT